MNKICITGNSKSGKSTFAISLAHALTKVDHDSSCIIIFCKKIPSIYSSIFPFISNENFLPLSNLISQNITPDILSKYIITKKTNPDTGYLGFTESDSKNTYPDIPKNICEKLISTLSLMSSYLIFDCDDNLFSQPLSNEAIKNSDIHFHILNPDIKSITYEYSTNDYIKEKGSGKQIYILNNLYESKYCDKSEIRYSYELPFRENILSEFHKGNILEKNMFTDQKCKSIILDIAKEIKNG